MKINNFIKNESGFTLVELIVVIVVVGIVTSAVSVHMNQSDQNAKVVNAAHAILTDLRYSQEIAMSNRRAVRFIISSTGYVAVWDDAITTILGRALGTDGSEVLVNFSNDSNFEGLTIATGLSGTLSFDATGAPVLGSTAFESGTAQTVAMIDGEMSIMIAPGTGFTYLQ